VNAPAPAANTNPSGQPGSNPYPAGVGEIVKMMNAGVDTNIIKTYIHGSFMYWNLSSQDIINLKQQGFPSDLVAAMLQRDAELRDQAMHAAQANPNPPSTTTDYGTNVPTVVTPTYDSGQYAGTGAYAYPVDYGYGGGAWPGWWGPWWGWGGWWGWPVWGGGFVFFNSFGHCNFNKNFHVNNFHNNFFHNNFHNNNFHGNNFHGSTAWNGHTGSGTWHGNTAAWNGHNTTVTRSTPVTTTRTMSGFAGTRSGAFAPAFGGRMGGTSRSFAPAGMASMGHFGGSSMGHMAGGRMGGGGHMGGGFAGGAGMHMGGSFGGGHGGGGGHR
jgi:hypothetical protein